MSSLPSKRLYMRGIAKDVTENDLYTCLSRHGKITEVKLLPNYAFVQFESEEDASGVLELYKTLPLLGKHVVIEFAHPLRKDLPSISSGSNSPKSHAPNGKSMTYRYPVVVLGLPRDIRWQELKDFGRLSGMLVAYCDLDKTQNGRGFIEYFTREDAQRAVRVLNGRRLGGQRVRVMDHEELRDYRNRGYAWGRRSRSPTRRRANYDDRAPTKTLSARQVYSPVRRVPVIDPAYTYAEHRYTETSACHMAAALATYNWSYDVANTSPGRAPFPQQDYDYMQPRSYHDLCSAYDYYDEALTGYYDLRDIRNRTSSNIDPYQ